MTPTPYVHGVGPAAPHGSRCVCGLPAAAQCQGCGGTYCRPCWWKHSHTDAELRLREALKATAPRVVGVDEGRGE